MWLGHVQSEEDAVGSKPEEESSGNSPVHGRAAHEQRLSVPPLCWPFPPGSQNHTDKAVKLKPYTPPKRRSLNQF